MLRDRAGGMTVREITEKYDVVPSAFYRYVQELSPGALKAQRRVPRRTIPHDETTRLKEIILSLTEENLILRSQKSGLSRQPEKD